MPDYSREQDIGKPKLVDDKDILLAIEVLAGSDSANIIDDIVDEPEEED